VLYLEVFAASSLKEAELRRHLESISVKYVEENVELEKNHRIKWSCIDRPSTLAVVDYSHSKVVRAFCVAWKILRAKAPYTAQRERVWLNP